MGTALKVGGLDGVVVAETRLSHVDGERGQLVLAGDNVEDLAGRRSFAEVAGRLWALGSGEHVTGVERALGQARVAAFEHRREDVGRMEVGMDALRAALARSVLPPGLSPVQEAALLTGSVAVHAAAWWRAWQALPPVAPDASLPHAADVLRMTTATTPSPALAAGLDAYLVTVMDHGMNASTFAARVVASTGSDAVSSVVAALGALKGPLHGGAPGPVLDMLDAIGTPENAAAWLEQQLLDGQRIMGMGHRIYRVRDPRARVLERQVESLGAAGVVTGRLALARAVERAAEGVLATRHPDRPLHANVEFYTAVLLDALGLDRAMFTPMFAVGRVAGWLAHVMEQRMHGRLIRPASTYVGEIPAPSTT